MDDERDVTVPFLDTVNGEIAFFRAITHARPVGINRHFHLLAVQQHIKNDAGQLVPIEQLWAKLESLYSLDALENMVCISSRHLLLTELNLGLIRLRGVPSDTQLWIAQHC